MTFIRLNASLLRQKAAIHDRLAIENGEEPKIVEIDSSDPENSVKTDEIDSDDENDAVDSDDENDTVDSGTTEPSTGLVKTESPAISENGSASNDQIVALDEILTLLMVYFHRVWLVIKKKAENEEEEEITRVKNPKKPEMRKTWK